MITIKKQLTRSAKFETWTILFAYPLALVLFGKAKIHQFGSHVWSSFLKGNVEFFFILLNKPLLLLPVVFSFLNEYFSSADIETRTGEQE